MKNTLRLSALIAALGGAAIGVASPALAQSRQEQQMAASLLMIQEQQQQLALAVAQLAETVKAVNPRFDDVIEAQRKRLADLEQLIKGQNGDVSAIRSQTQETGTRIGSLSDEIEALRKTVDALGQVVIQLQQQQLAPAPIDPNAPPGPISQGAPPVPGTPTAPVAVPTLGSSPLRMLSEAKSDYQGGNYSVAISGFEAVIRVHGGTAAAAEAQFLIGESYKSDSKWTEAIAAYNTAIKNYPTSQWVPDAHYGRADAEIRGGQAAAGRATLELLAKTYPESNAGQLAVQRLRLQPRPQ